MMHVEKCKDACLDVFVLSAMLVVDLIGTRKASHFWMQFGLFGLPLGVPPGQDLYITSLRQAVSLQILFQKDEYIVPVHCRYCPEYGYAQYRFALGRASAWRP
jgi:hypothetical protein